MNEQISVLAQQFPAFYNHSLIDWWRRKLGWTILYTAEVTGAHRNTVRAVLRGRASSKQVFQVACAMGLNWAVVHDLFLPESHFYLAQQNGLHEGRQLIAPKEASSNSP